MKSLVLAVSAIALFSTAALAQDVVPSKAVSFGDLNLSSPEGVSVLRDRIAAAVKEVCVTDAKPVETNCRRIASNRAFSEVGNKIAQRLASAQ